MEVLGWWGWEKSVEGCGEYLGSGGVGGDWNIGGPNGTLKIWGPLKYWGLKGFGGPLKYRDLKGLGAPEILGV